VLGEWLLDHLSRRYPDSRREFGRGSLMGAGKSLARSYWMKCGFVISGCLAQREDFLPPSKEYRQPWSSKRSPFRSPQIDPSLDKMDYRGNTKSFNVNSFNKIVHTTIADDEAQVLQWLSPLEPQKRHQHLRESRQESVGQWIFRESKFQRWNTGEDGSGHPVLFCHGDPGVGKTHLR